MYLGTQLVKEKNDRVFREVVKVALVKAPPQIVVSAARVIWCAGQLIIKYVHTGCLLVHHNREHICLRDILHCRYDRAVCLFEIARLRLYLVGLLDALPEIHSLSFSETEIVVMVGVGENLRFGLVAPSGIDIKPLPVIRGVTLDGLAREVKVIRLAALGEHRRYLSNAGVDPLHKRFKVRGIVHRCRGQLKSGRCIILGEEMYNLVCLGSVNDASDEVCNGHARSVFMRLLYLVGDVLCHAADKLGKLVDATKSRVELVAENGYALLVDIRAVIVRLDYLRLIDGVLVDSLAVSESKTTVVGKRFINIVDFAGNAAPALVIHQQPLKFGVIGTDAKNATTEYLRYGRHDRFCSCQQRSLRNGHKFVGIYGRNAGCACSLRRNAIKQRRELVKSETVYGHLLLPPVTSSAAAR